MTLININFIIEEIILFEFFSEDLIESIDNF